MHLKNSHVKSASPGDIIQIQGILFPHRRPGYRYQHELAFDSHLEALKVTREKKKYIDMAMSQSEIDFIYQTRGSMEESVLFNKLAASIAPEIYGLATVKKALLLLMVGGITQ